MTTQSPIKRKTIKEREDEGIRKLINLETVREMTKGINGNRRKIPVTERLRNKQSKAKSMSI